MDDALRTIAAGDPRVHAPTLAGLFDHAALQGTPDALTVLSGFGPARGALLELVALAHPTREWGWVEARIRRARVGVTAADLIYEALTETPADSPGAYVVTQMSRFRPKAYYEWLDPSELPIHHQPKAVCSFHGAFVDLFNVELAALSDPTDTAAEQGAHQRAIARWQSEYPATQKAHECRFHNRYDITQVVALADSLFNAISEADWSMDAVYDHLPGIDDPLRDAVLHMFLDPLEYDPGAGKVGNGQHRLCAARAAGVTRLPVITRFD